MEAMQPYIEPASPVFFVRASEMIGDTPPPEEVNQTIPNKTTCPNPRKRRRRDGTHFSRLRNCRRESRASAAAAEPNRNPVYPLVVPPPTPESMAITGDEETAVGLENLSPWPSSISTATTFPEVLSAAMAAFGVAADGLAARQRWGGGGGSSDSDREVGGLWGDKEGDEGAVEARDEREELKKDERVGGASWLSGGGQQVWGNRNGGGGFWGDSSGRGVGLWEGVDAGLCEMMMEVIARSRILPDVFARALLFRSRFFGRQQFSEDVSPWQVEPDTFEEQVHCVPALSPEGTPTNLTLIVVYMPC